MLFINNIIKFYVYLDRNFLFVLSRGFFFSRSSANRRARDRDIWKRVVLTVLGGVVVGAVHRAVRQDLQMPVLDVHLYLPRGAGDVGEVGRPLGPDARVAKQIDRRRTHTCTDNRTDRQDTY